MIQSRHNWMIASLLLALSQASRAGIEDSSFFGNIELDPISYYAIPSSDRVARLQEKIDSGEVTLRYEPGHGYLPSLMEHLQIDRNTQSLVFSKTSFQLKKIWPHQPRAVYFNDDTYVGWVRDGEVIELASVDGRRGTVFYTLSQRTEDKPRFLRDNSCLQCHASGRTLGVPGPMVRSVFPDANGFPIVPAGGYVTNHRSPLDQRWGGWYVTGSHGRQRHMGNACVQDPQNKPDALDVEQGANTADLSRFFNTRPYLTAHSDIAALMVLEHQTYLQNLLTRAGFEVATLLYYESAVNRRLGQSEQGISESTHRRIDDAADTLLRYMLMVDEVCLDEPVSGDSGFAKWFSSQGPRDRSGRSLRELDLRKFLFRYPCSYMIYSPAFDGLHPVLRDRVYRRLYEILSGADRSDAWSSLATHKRRAILEILRDTKPDLPAYFHHDP